MSKIAFIVPFPEMERTVHKAWDVCQTQALENHLYPDRKFEYSIITYTHRGGTPQVDTDADVIVARGATALGLKQLYLHQNKHVVEIPVTATDLVSTIRRAVKRYGDLPIAITGTFNMTYGSSAVLRSKRYSARLYHSDEVDERSYEAMVRKASDDGCKIIIGGVHTTEYARSLGLYSERLDTSTDSMIQAVSNAKAAAVIAEKERERALLNQNIIDNISSGILAIDKQGSIIAINRAARLLLSESGDKIPATLDKLGLPARFCRTLTHPRPFENAPVPFGDRQLLLSKSSIPYGEDDSVYLITLQSGAPAVHPETDSADALEDLEKRRILDCLYKCGFCRGEAAEMLGMSRSTLWRKLKKYGID